MSNEQPKYVQDLIRASRVPGLLAAVFVYRTDEGQKQATYVNNRTEHELHAEGGFFDVERRECFTLRMVWTPRPPEVDPDA